MKSLGCNPLLPSLPLEANWIIERILQYSSAIAMPHLKVNGLWVTETDSATTFTYIM